MMRRGLLLLCFVLLPPSSSRAQSGARPFALDDFSRIRALQGITASPDGRSAVLQIGTSDTAHDVYTSDLWLLDLDSGALSQLGRNAGSESDARFSPDGHRVAFLAARSGKATGIYTLTLAGGEATALVQRDDDIESFSWFADGRRIVFVAKAPAPAGGARKGRALVYTRTRFKDDDEGYLDGRRRHLWVGDLQSGEVRQLTDGEYDESAPVVSPDGRWVAFISDRNEAADERPNTDVYLVPAAGGRVTRVSTLPGLAYEPRWSPDGRSLAWIEQQRPLDYGDIAYVWVSAVSGVTDTAPVLGAPRNVTAALNLSVGEGSYFEGGAPYPIWSPDSRRLYIAVETRARLHGYAVDVKSGRATLLTGGDWMTEFLTPTGDGKRIVYGITDALHLTDVWVASADGSTPRQLTHLNDDWLREVRVSPVERFLYRSRDGTEVEGFTVKPLDWRPGKPSPTVLTIHGGPQWYYPVSFQAFFQYLVGKGYLVIYTNPRGSTSYGQDFSSRIRGRYGSEDYDDLMAGVDAVVARGWVDTRNLFLHGYSYGGVMTNWIIGHTDRFTAAASGGSVSDNIGAFGSDDEAEDWIAQWGLPWADSARYREQSPFTYVGQVKTPTLFYHAEDDHRCPVAESERMFTALKLLGVDTRLAIFPDESHGFWTHAGSYPERVGLVVEWFDGHRR